MSSDVCPFQRPNGWPRMFTLALSNGHNTSQLTADPEHDGILSSLDIVQREPKNLVFT